MGHFKCSVRSSGCWAARVCFAAFREPERLFSKAACLRRGSPTLPASVRRSRFRHDWSDARWKASIKLGSSDHVE